jgi:hypothetical protein
LPTPLFRLSPEDSAQGSSARSNPMLRRAVDKLTEERDDLRSWSVADQGAGRLRHLSSLATVFGSVVLVDTARQVTRLQVLHGRRQRVTDFARVADVGPSGILVASSTAFGRSHLELDAIFSICVFAAVPPFERKSIASAACRNLRPGGRYFVIVHRNDSSILRRCARHNSFADGHVFSRHGSHTFFHNFRDQAPLIRLIERTGLVLVSDRSRYRHIFLEFRRP